MKFDNETMFDTVPNMRSEIGNKNTLLAGRK